MRNADLNVTEDDLTRTANGLNGMQLHSGETGPLSGRGEQGHHALAAPGPLPAPDTDQPIIRILNV